MATDSPRVTRFWLSKASLEEAEDLSTRISSLRDGVSAAGQVLGEFMDGSRKPVLYAIPKEQRRLEQSGIIEMEDDYSFITNIVTQLKKWVLCP